MADRQLGDGDKGSGWAQWAGVELEEGSLAPCGPCHASLQGCGWASQSPLPSRCQLQHIWLCSPGPVAAGALDASCCRDVASSPACGVSFIGSSGGKSTEIPDQCGYLVRPPSSGKWFSAWNMFTYSPKQNSVVCLPQRVRNPAGDTQPHSRSKPKLPKMRRKLRLALCFLRCFRNAAGHLKPLFNLGSTVRVSFCLASCNPCLAVPLTG